MRVPLVLIALGLSACMILGCAGGGPELTSGKVALQSKQYDRAIKNLELAVQNDPGNAEAHFYLGSAYAETKDYVKAGRHLRKTKSLDTGKWGDEAARTLTQQWTEHFNRGVEYQKEGKNPQAESEFLIATQLDSSDARAFVNLGFVYYSIDNCKDAASAFGSAIAADSANADAWKGLGAAYDKCGEKEKALDAFRAMLKRNPDDAEVWSKVASSLQDAGDIEGAEKILTEALTHFPNDMYLLYDLGFLNYKKEDYSKAITYFERSAEVSAEQDEEVFLDSWYKIALSYFKMEEYAKADKVLVQLLERKPDSPVYHTLRGQTLTKLGRVEEGLAEIEKATELRNR